MTEQNKYSGMLPVGYVLHGTYRIESYLASGGFGNTYVAKNLQFDETVAIKEFFMKGVSKRDDDNSTVSVSTPEGTATFESQKEKFKKEARRLRKLHSDHIVRVHDLFEENGTAYYAMDYINGESLSARLKRYGHPFHENEVLDILNQMLDALDSIYNTDNPILHLDIKPGNIMIDGSGKITLIDFGASKQVATDAGSPTTSAISYTNGYAPLEQMEKDMKRFGPWTDLYALGATLYTLLCNEKPPMPSEILADTSADKHEALPFNKMVSERMRKLVVWMLQPARKARPQSVKEIRDYLDNKTTVEDPTILDVPSHNDDPSKPRHPAGKKPKKGASSLIIVLSAIIVIGVVIALIFASGHGSSSNSEISDSTLLDSAVVDSDSVDTAAVDTVESIPVQEAKVKKYDWSGTYYAETDMGSNAGGTAVLFEIEINLHQSGNDDNEYTGTMSINGYQTGEELEITAYANQDKLRINSVKTIAGMSTISDNERLVTIYYNKDGSLTADWHLAMEGYYNENTTFEKKK